MKAYQVRDNYEGYCVIVFAKHAVVARREGANELNIDFSDVEECKRAPWADEYADEPFIPAQVLIEQGWWMDCCNRHCGTRVSECSIDADYLEPAYDGRNVFCSQECANEHERTNNDHAK